MITNIIFYLHTREYDDYFVATLTVLTDISVMSLIIILTHDRDMEITVCSLSLL